jgi:cation diffusion facilitator CzcD-associated flavoprotein CzcO
VTEALRALEAEAARALAYEGNAPANWVMPRNGVDHDILIVGGGQSGLALSFALRRSGIARLSSIEAQPAGQAGIWDTPARMRTLRTQKTLVGPDMGFVPLSFPRWYEAQHGIGSFDAVTRADRTDWADYLRWFEAQSGAAIRHDTRLVRLEPDGEHFRVHIERDGVASVEVSRKVVLATGLLGMGTPSVPPILTEGLPSSRYRHTSQQIDFIALADKDVGVIGTGASAFDAAAVALEAGAASVHMLCRKPAIPTLQVNQPRGYPGAADNYPELPDAVRWTLFNRVSRGGTPPPTDSVLRVIEAPNFHIYLATEISTVRVENGRIVAATNREPMTLDFIVAATGYLQDPRLRPELADVAAHIALWQDRFEAPVTEANPALATYPYLGPGLQFVERVPGAAPYLKNLHCYTAAAALSFGRLIGDLPSMAWGISRLTSALTKDLFYQDFDRHRERITSQSTSVEFNDDLYRSRVWAAT